MTVKTARTADVTNPPKGVRLQVSSIAAELGVTFSQMASATGISRTAVFAIADENVWPVKTDPQQIRDAIRALFEARGATDEQLSSLFHMHMRRPAAQAGGTPATRTGSMRIASDHHRPETPTEEVTDMLPPKQTLSMPARKAFQLFTNPFDGDVVDDAQMFTSNEVAFAREACRQAALNGRFVALVGESGAGKSTVLADLEARIENERQPVVVIRPSTLGMEGNDTTGKTVKASELLMAMVTALNPLVTIKQTMQGRTTQVVKLLSESCEQGNKHLLLIEEAHRLPEATLKHLKGMNELKLGRTPMLGILLVAQPELKETLKHRATYLREVIQRLEVVDLLPLDNDLSAYLTCRAAAHGRKLADLIDATGIEEIRARLMTTRRDASGRSRTVSLCYPLAVNNMLTAALNMAAEIGAPVVTRDVVRAA